MTAAAIALVWTAIAIAAGMLIGRAIRRRDTFPAQVWPDWPSGDDLIDLDQPYEVLTPADQLRYVERMWSR